MIFVNFLLGVQVCFVGLSWDFGGWLFGRQLHFDDPISATLLDCVLCFVSEKESFKCVFLG